MRAPIGKGRYLFHNDVRHSRTMECGDNGFRSWTNTKKLPGFHLCKCGWSDLPRYSRMSSDYRCEPRSRLPR
jgi:hypothetical protein